jgi:formylglycine-generating enzyme required for sulfatase activity
MSTFPRSGLFACVFGAIACAPPPGQLVVVVDTDAPVPGQLLGAPELSADAAVDTLWIELLDPDGGRPDADDSCGPGSPSCIVVAPDASNWPVSFGVETPEGSAGQIVMVRLRLFRGSFVGRGAQATEPLAEVTIERLVSIELPDAPKDALVTLSLACMGRPVDFVSRVSCVDASRLSADAGALVAPDLEPRGNSVVGTSPIAREVPCSGKGPSGSVCVKGGFSLLGSLFEGGPTALTADPTPPQPVVLSPFWIDRTEVTVERFLAASAATALEDAPLEIGDCREPTFTYCTQSGERPDLPINCVRWVDARDVCLAAGGDLPTEAQWEHAARGRGQGRRYPWGDAAPSCDTATLAQGLSCGGCRGADVVGSRPDDVSRDGIHDLGGNVAELTLDSWALYEADPELPTPADPWQTPGILSDPWAQGTSARQVVRGGAWRLALTSALAMQRGFRWSNTFREGRDRAVGFRCAYPDQVDLPPPSPPRSRAP